MYCSNCGKKIDSNAKFCPYCGAKVGISDLPSNLFATPKTFHETEYSNKNRTTAGILGLFLGVIGVHNFYLGHKTKGIVKVAFSIISIVLLFIGIGIAATAVEINPATGDMITLNEGALFLAGLIILLAVFIMIPISLWAFVEAIIIFVKKDLTDGDGLKVQ